MLGGQNERAPVNGHHVFPDVDPGDCKVHTGIPSNSLRCTFSPSVVNRGGLSLDSSCAIGVVRSTPKRSPTAPRTRKTAVKTWDTNDGSPVNVAGSAVASSCGLAVRTDTPAGGAPVSPVTAGSIDWLIERRGVGDEPVGNLTGQRVDGRRRGGIGTDA